MEKESFEDSQVADILNEDFISIKVDREERPDIDSIYMTYCQAITGSGGWPLSIFMTSDRKPFFAGTYFPKNSKYGRQGLIQILQSIKENWSSNKNKLIESSNNMHKELSKTRYIKEKEMDQGIVLKAANQLKIHYEPKFGGFSDSPKFPTPHNLLFLLRYYYINKDEETLKIVENTLMSMYKGGIFDHIGFGFSRYSTDKKWLVPHFEKMLYDNALLAIAYVEAYQATKNKLYREIAEKIFEYELRDMNHKDGGFYSAEDADSEGVEGKFYVWSREEVINLLGKEQGEVFCKYYDITNKGNFEGKNIPNLIYSNIDKMEVHNKLREKLFINRECRIHPFKDDKILTSWNGLMIAALAYAGRVFNNQKYIEAAVNSSKFIINNMIREDGRLMARYRDGNVANLGLLDDYAFFVWGLLETYGATFDSFYLEKAIELNNKMIELFYDKDLGGFFLYGSDGEELILRPKDFYDGALPSGNSVAISNLIKISKMLGNNSYDEEIYKSFKYTSSMIEQNPAAYTYLIEAYFLSISSIKEIVISGDKLSPKVKSMINIVNSSFLPFSTVLLNFNDGELEKLIPFIKNQSAKALEAVAYVCQNYSCSEPTSDLEKFKISIDKL